MSKAIIISESEKKKILGLYGLIKEDTCEGDCKNGVGVLTTPIGTFEGTFKNGKLNGQGKITFISGDKQEGIFLDNVLNGQGKRIDNIQPLNIIKRGESRDKAIRQNKSS